MRKWTECLELLSDGEWCSRTRLQKELELSEFQAGLLCNFLVSFGFCTYRLNGDNVMEVKLKSAILRFLEKLDEMEDQN